MDDMRSKLCVLILVGSGVAATEVKCELRNEVHHCNGLDNAIKLVKATLDACVGSEVRASIGACISCSVRRTEL